MGKMSAEGIKPLFLTQELLHDVQKGLYPQPLADNLDTDALYPVPQLFKTIPKEMQTALFSGIDWWKDARLKLTPDQYDTLVAGDSLGIGSSRENPAETIRSLGIERVFAKSFGPIFKINLINHGIIPCNNNMQLLQEMLDGRTLTFEELTKDLSEGQRRILKAKGLPPYMMAISQGREPLPQSLVERRSPFPQTAVEKIVSREAGRLIKETKPLKAGDSVILKVDKLTGYDVFWAHTQRVLEKYFAGNITMEASNVMLFTDHFRQNPDPDAQKAVSLVEKFWAENPDTPIGDDGIYNQVMSRRLPPETIIAGMDSHTNELGLGPGNLPLPTSYTAGACALATDGLLPYTIPETTSLNISGELPAYCDIKDAIWGIVGNSFNKSQGDGKMIEIGGPGYARLIRSEAAKIFNATTEFGAIGAIGVTSNPSVNDYLREHGTGYSQLSETDIQKIYERIRPDEKAEYASKINYNLEDTQPVIVGPDSHKKYSTLDEFTGQRDIDRVIYVSCGGTSLSDLAILAEILKEGGRKIPVDIQLADPLVKYYAQRQGILAELTQIGVRISDQNSCGPCLSQGAKVESGERVVATSNRNSKGRMGASDAEVYLASSPVAAIVASIGRVPMLQDLVRFEQQIRTAKDNAKF